MESCLLGSLPSSLPKSGLESTRQCPPCHVTLRSSVPSHGFDFLTDNGLIVMPLSLSGGQTF